MNMNMNLNMNMKDLNGMDKYLHETCTWNYFRMWYMVIIWAWQGHGGIVILGTWFTQDIHIQ